MMRRLRVPIAVAEKKLLAKIVDEMLSTEGVALLERRYREHIREQAHAPKAVPKPQAAQLAEKTAEIEQLRALM